MRTKVLLAAVLCFGLGAPAAHPQASPYSNSVFPAKIFTTTGTSTAIQLNGLVVSSTVGSSFASGTITLTGTSLTTVTFAVQGSSDNGGTYYALPISTVASPTTTPTTTITATTNGLYQVNLAGLTHVRFVTSGTFTATNVSMVLSASPNGQISKNGNGGGSGINQLTGDVTAGPGTGSQVAILPTVNGSPGSCGDATHVCQVTTNGKGLTTAQAQISIAGGISGTLVDNTLIGSATGNFLSANDSIGLRYLGGFGNLLAQAMSVPGGSISDNACGSGSLADLLNYSSSFTGGLANCGNAATITGSLPLTWPLGITSNTLFETDMSNNDISNMGDNPTLDKLDYFHGGYLAWIIETGTPDTQKIFATNPICSTTGTWVAAGSPYPTGALKATSNGATMTCAGLNATDAGFISSRIVGDTATYTVAVTSNGNTVNATDYYASPPATTITTSAPYTSNWGATQNLYAIGVPQLPGGYVSMTLTTVSASVGDPVIVVGPYFLAKDISLQFAPKVLVYGGVYYCGNASCSIDAGHTDAVVNIIRDEQKKAVKEAHDNGINAKFADLNANTGTAGTAATGYNTNNVNDTGEVRTVTVTGGGSGYASAVLNFAGCTISPVVTAAVSGGVLTAATYTATSVGQCPSNSITVTGTGGTGATFTVGYFADGTHPNVGGSAKIAAVGAAAANSAVAVQDRDSSTRSVFAGGAPVSATALPVGALGSNTGPTTGVLYMGADGLSNFSRGADRTSGYNAHEWYLGVSDTYGVELTESSAGIVTAHNIKNLAASGGVAVERFITTNLGTWYYASWGPGNTNGLAGTFGVVQESNVSGSATNIIPLALNDAGDLGLGGNMNGAGQDLIHLHGSHIRTMQADNYTNIGGNYGTLAHTFSVGPSDSFTFDPGTDSFFTVNASDTAQIVFGLSGATTNYKFVGWGAAIAATPSALSIYEATGNKNLMTFTAAFDLCAGGNLSNSSGCAGANIYSSHTGLTTMLGTFALSSAEPTVSASQIGLGSSVSANTNCGTLASSAGCWVFNVAGTTHYIPYY